MDRKLISVALIATALVLVSMVSVGLSYSSVYVTEENTCTITCTYGYGETSVTGVGVKSGSSDLTFSSKNISDDDPSRLNVTYNDTKAGGRVGLNISVSGATAFAQSLWTVNILVNEKIQTGYVDVGDDGNATIYGFFFDLGEGVKEKQLVITSNFGKQATSDQTLQITIKAIRGDN